MSHQRIEELILRTIQETETDATLTRDAKVPGNMYVDIVKEKDGQRIAFEIKTTNFFDGLGRASIWKDYFDSVYLVVPRSILPNRQVLQRIPKQIGIVAFKLDNSHLQFEMIRQAKSALPDRLFRGPFAIEMKLHLTKTTTISLVSPKAFRVVKYLLIHNETTQKEISKETRVSIGMANKVISRLRERDIVTYKKRRFVLVEPWKLLNEVSWERPMTKLKINDYYISRLQDVGEAEKYLHNVCNENGTRYCLTLFSGANRYVGYSKRYDSVYSYIEPSKRLMNVLSNSLGKVGEGIRLELFGVDNPDILDEAKTFEGLTVCSPTQVLIDLSSYGYAGKDVAVELYRELSR